MDVFDRAAARRARRRSFGACDDLLWELDEVRDGGDEPVKEVEVAPSSPERAAARATERLRPWSFAAHNARKILATAPASSRYTAVTLRVDGVDGADAGAGELIQLADAVLWSKSSEEQPCFCFRKSCLTVAHVAGNILTIEATAPSFSGSLRLDFQLPGSRGTAPDERARHFAPLIALSRSVTAKRRQASTAALAAELLSPATRTKTRAACFLGGRASGEADENAPRTQNIPPSTSSSADAPPAAAAAAPCALYKAEDAIDDAWKAEVRRFARLRLQCEADGAMEGDAAREACGVAEALVLSIGYTIGKTEVGPVKRRSRRRMLKALLPLAEEMEAARKADCRAWEQSTHARCDEGGGSDGSNIFFDIATGEAIAVEVYEARCTAAIAAAAVRGAGCGAAAAVARDAALPAAHALPPLPSPAPVATRARAHAPADPAACAQYDAAVAAAEERLWSGFDAMLAAFAVEKQELAERFGL